MNEISILEVHLQEYCHYQKIHENSESDEIHRSIRDQISNVEIRNESDFLKKEKSKGKPLMLNPRPTGEG